MPATEQSDCVRSRAALDRKAKPGDRAGDLPIRRERRDAGGEAQVRHQHGLQHQKRLALGMANAPLKHARLRPGYFYAPRESKAAIIRRTLADVDS